MNTKNSLFLILMTLLLSACSAGSAAVMQAPQGNSTTAQQASPTAAALPATPEVGNATPADYLPPKEAVNACTGKAEQDACTFTAGNGTESGVCKASGTDLACYPNHGPAGGGHSAGGTPQATPDASQPGYNIDQAISDKAQGMTIAFDALGFLTGDLGADSFFPPGKVADYWGFQYLRDNDPSQMGHAGEFLTSASENMLNVLTAGERAQLVALAKAQVSAINDYAYQRFVLMQAFENLKSGKLPAGTSALSEDAVKAYSGQLYQLDGEISYARAQLYGTMISTFTADQKAQMDAMKGKGMKEWPTVIEPADIQGLDRDVKVAVMTYAGDMFSWYVGSVDADVYFCPERHGTYFGSFYLKDIKAMSDPTYAIPTDMTGNLGDEMIASLTADQAQRITGLVDLQKTSLLGIVDTRRQLSIELRKFMAGGTADKDTVLALSEHYGELDGEIIYNLAVHFTQVNQSLSADQKAKLSAMRTQLLGDLSHPTGAFLYSQPIAMPAIPSSDFLFQ